MCVLQEAERVDLETQDPPPTFPPLTDTSQVSIVFRREMLFLHSSLSSGTKHSSTRTHTHLASLILQAAKQNCWLSLLTTGLVSTLLDKFVLLENVLSKSTRLVMTVS